MKVIDRFASSCAKTDGNNMKYSEWHHTAHTVTTKMEQSWVSL